MSPLLLVLVGVAGGLGAVCRYGLDALIRARFPGRTFPWSTAVINVSGSLLLGLVVDRARLRRPVVRRGGPARLGRRRGDRVPGWVHDLLDGLGRSRPAGAGAMLGVGCGLGGGGAGDRHGGRGRGPVAGSLTGVTVGMV